MTTTCEAKRMSSAFAQRLIILVLAIGAILLALSAPVAHAAPPNDGPGIEPWPPNAPSNQYPPLTLPSVQASQNPVVFYVFETKKTIELTWTPYPWGPVQLRFEAIDPGPQHAGHHPPTDPSVTDPNAHMEVKYGRVYHVWLKSTQYPGEKVGPTLTITTVRVELGSIDPPPTRVNPNSIPGDNPHPDPSGTQRLDPGAAAPNTTRERTSGAQSGEDSKTR